MKSFVWLTLALLTATLILTLEPGSLVSAADVSQGVAGLRNGMT